MLVSMVNGLTLSLHTGTTRRKKILTVKEQGMRFTSAAQDSQSRLTGQSEPVDIASAFLGMVFEAAAFDEGKEKAVV